MPCEIMREVVKNRFRIGCTCCRATGVRLWHSKRFKKSCGLRKSYQRANSCKAAADIASVTRDAEQSAVKHNEDSSTFSWTKQWYPVAIENALHTDRPNQVRLLGQAFVLWRDKNKKWHCWKDLCPHRLAPLSEGRIEHGELMCSYHGWTFGADGNCTRIPQADDDKSFATAVSSRRACVASHPLKAADGLIWVWADDSKEAAAESRAKEPPLHPLASAADTVWVAQWFMRDLPYGHDVLAENVLDPSHVCFSHHGILGDRNKPGRFTMSAAVDIEPQKGWQVDLKREAHGKRGPSDDKVFWQPPTLVKYEYASGMVMMTHAVPTDPGRSRLFFAMLQSGSKAPKALKILLPLLYPPWMQWRAHFSQHNVLDGDSVFLHHQVMLNGDGDEVMMQDQALQQTEWKKSYWLPTSKDAAVVGLRRWLSEVAGPLPWAPAALPQPQGVSEEELLDRFHQHTQHCPSCSAAFKVFNTLTTVARVALAVSTAVLVGAATQAANFKNLIKPGLCTALLLSAAIFCARIRQKFLFVPYKHYEHN